MKFFLSLVFTLLGTITLIAEPTEEREWTSTANTTISGRAVALANDIVELHTTDGRKLKVPLNKLVPDDQQFLKKHFVGKMPNVPELVSPSNLPFEQGKVHGPIDTGDDSTYYLYLPKSLSEGYEAPLFFWTESGKTKVDTLDPFIKAAELTGMILATSVESRNNNKGPITNVEHSGHCLEHLQRSLPIAKGRIFFSGRSGGGAVAFLNADSYKCAGIFPYVSYMPHSKTPKNGDYVYAAGGASDYNRYLSAFAAQSYGKNGTHRLYRGGHHANLKEIPTEGICWLYSRELYNNLEGREEERQRFEARFLNYLREELIPQQPHLAFYWCDHFLNLCQIDGPLKETLQTLSEELAPTHQRYLDGRKALEAFSEDIYAELGKKGGSQGGHTTGKIQSAAEKLAEEFKGVVEIGEITRELGNETKGF